MQKQLERQYTVANADINLIYQIQLGADQSDAAAKKLFPRILSVEQFILFYNKGQVRFDARENSDFLTIDWEGITIKTDKHLCVVAKNGSERVMVSNNEGRQKGKLDILFTLPSEHNSGERHLIMVYANGCIETRDMIYHEHYRKRLALELRSHRQQHYQTLMQEVEKKIVSIDDSQQKIIVNSVMKSAAIMNKQLKNNTELTRLLTTLNNALAQNVKANDEHSAPVKEFISDATSFLQSRYTRGVVWGTIVMIAGLTLAGLAALFFAGVLIGSGLGAVIIGTITGALSLAMLITDSLAIKDTYQLGRLRHDLKQLTMSFEKTHEQSHDRNHFHAIFSTQHL